MNLLTKKVKLPRKPKGCSSQSWISYSVYGIFV